MTEFHWCATCHCSHPTGTLCPETGKLIEPSAEGFKPLTGGSSDYYKLDIEHPTSGGIPYTAECNDIIEALGLTFAEGNVLKAVWRHALARQGKGKQGNTAKYDAEKIVFFGERLVEQAK